MENDTRNSRIKEMTDAINKIYSEGTKKEYDIDDEPFSSNDNFLTGEQSTVNIPRSERVATGMRSSAQSRSSRVTTVDMSSMDTENISDSSADSYVRNQSHTSVSVRASHTTGTTKVSGSSRTSSSARSSSSSRTSSSSGAGRRPSQTRASGASRSSASSSRSSGSVRNSGSSRVTGSSRTAASVHNADRNRTVASSNRKYSEILEENRKKRTGSSGKNAVSSKKRSQNTSKKGLSVFSKFLIVYSAILLIAIIVVSIILNSFLKNFEKNQPTNVAVSVVSQFESSDKLRAFLDENASITNQDTAILNYEEAFISAVEGKKISYVEDPSNTTSEVTCYKITADSIPVASIKLTKGDKGAFGLATWILSGIDTSNAFKDVKTYSILVPEGSTVIVNGTALSSSMISGTGIPEVLETSKDYISAPPTYDTYNVKVVDEGIEVSGTDSTGANLVFSQNENSFVAGGQASADFIESVQDRVESGLREYALYFIYEAFDLESYIVDGCELYAFIFGGTFDGESYDPINPWLYNFEYIDDFEFSTFEAKNYTRYSDDCFTVDINYKLDITFTEESYSDDNQKLDATWVWVRNGDEWYISSSKTH